MASSKFSPEQVVATPRALRAVPSGLLEAVITGNSREPRRNAIAHLVRWTLEGTARRRAAEKFPGELRQPRYALAMQREPRRLWGHSGTVRIEAVEWSQPGRTDEGLPMVFIPGGTGNAMFAEVHGEAAIAGRLGPRTRRVLGVSRRGTGRSDAPAAGYAPSDFASDVSAAIAAAGYERCAVFGHSMGVPIALELALRRPEGLAALILGDHPPRYIDFKADGTFTSILQEDFSFASRDAARATIRPSGDPDLDERRWQWLRRARLAANDDGSVRLLLDRAALLRTVEESVLAHMDYAPRLDEITCPVLLLLATIGRSPLAASDVELYRSSVRDLTIVSLPTDHTLGQYTDPAPLHAALGEVLQRADSELANR